MCHLRRLASIACVSLCLGPILLAQQNAPQATTSCNINPQKQVVLRYQAIKFSGKKSIFGHKIPYDEVWAPGGKPMILFANAPLKVGSTMLSPGAYTVFLIPSEKQWTLVVSKSTDVTGRYEQQDDLARVPMDRAELPSPEENFKAVFVHVAPTQCNLRVYLHRSAVWVGFQAE